MKRLKLAMAMTLLVSAGLLGGCATTSGDDGKIILGKLAVNINKDKMQQPSSNQNQVKILV